MFDFFFSEIIGSFVLIPILLILATPFVLLISFKGKKGYWKNIGENYRTVIKWWKNNIL